MSDQLPEEQNKGGRPRHYDDAVEFASMAESYFTVCEEKDRVPTLAGLALHLGFVSRQSLVDYAKDDRFSDAVSCARLRIEADRSERLVLKDKYTPGLPMDLASNHGWITSKNANEHTGKNGGPIASVDLTKFTPEQLEQYGRLSAIAEGIDPDSVVESADE